MRRLAVLIRPPVDPRSDGALLAAFLAERDEAAFAELVRRHGPLVWATCRRSLPDPADAEDAFQATFLVLVRRAGRLTSSETLGPWLYKVAGWTARALRRKNARRRSLFGRLPGCIPDSRAAADPTFELDDLLLGLPEKYRSAVILCNLQGLTHREAADRLGCAEGTVASLVSRALVKLRAKLVGRDPASLFAVAMVGTVPAALSSAAVRSAAALRIASLSAAAPPAVARLTEGVLRMFWVKKLTATGLAAALILVAGVGVGLGVRHTPAAVAVDPPKDAPAVAAVRPPVDDDAAALQSLKKMLADLEANQKQAQRDEAAVRQKITEVEARRAARRPGPFQPLPRFLLQVSGPAPTGTFHLTEYRANGEVAWFVTFPMPKEGEIPSASLQDFLTRTRKDVGGPLTISLSAAVDAKFHDVFTAASVCKAAGFDQVRFTGYVPIGKIREQPKPGPGGEAVGYKRYLDEPYKADDLESQLMAVLFRC